MRCAVTRRSAATCSRSGVLGSARSVFVPPRTPAFARSTNDCSTGARAMSFTVEPGLHDAGVEIGVRVALAAHEVIVLQRDALQLDRQLEQAVVVQAELVQHLVAGLAHELRARIVVLVDAVAEAHQTYVRALVL